MDTPIGQLTRLLYFSSDEDVAIVLHRVKRPRALHLHEFFEVVYVERGMLLHRHGSTLYGVGAGDVFIVNPRIPHGYELVATQPPPRGARIWNLLLIEGALSSLAHEPALSSLIGQVTGHERSSLHNRPVRLAGKERRIVDRTIKEMWSEYMRKKSGYRTMLHGGAAIVLTTIGRALAREGHAAETNGRYTDIAEIIRYIMDHCHEPLRVTELAKDAGWSAGHLNRMVKETTGDTVQEYIGRARAAKAAQLLLTKDWSVEQVASSVGYGNARAFRRAFQRYYVKAPSEFRLSD